MKQQADYNTWTHVCFNAVGIKKVSTPYILALTLHRPKDVEHIFTLLAWEADNPQQPGTIGYSGMLPIACLPAGQDKLSAMMAIAKEELKVNPGTVIKGLGIKGMRLFSWNLAEAITISSNSTGKRVRGSMKLVHCLNSHIVLEFNGPWVASTNSDSAKKAMYDDWNLKMKGFQNINDTWQEEEALSYLSQPAVDTGTIPLAERLNAGINAMKDDPITVGDDDLPI